MGAQIVCSHPSKDCGVAAGNPRRVIFPSALFPQEQ